MSEEEISLLTKNIEIFLRRQEQWEYKDLESQARELIALIRGEGYEIRRWSVPNKYLLVVEGERIPVCRGCFNEFESCGTPCVNGCDKKESFDKEWDWFMMFPKQFDVYKRKEKN